MVLPHLSPSLSLSLSLLPLSLPLSPPYSLFPPRSYKDHILHHPVVSPIITGPLLLSITLYTTPDKSFSLIRKKQVPSQNLPCRDKSCIIQTFRSQSAIIHYYVHGTILHTSVTKRVPPPPPSQRGFQDSVNELAVHSAMLSCAKSPKEKRRETYTDTHTHDQNGSHRGRSQWYKVTELEPLNLQNEDTSLFT